MLHRRIVMACRTRFACLAILTALAAVACFAPVASAGVFTPLQLSKSGPTYVNQGDSAEYTFSLSNPNGSDVTDVTVADDKCSPLSAPSGDNGDGILKPGETWTYTCSYVPPGNPGDEIDNHATADGTMGGEAPVHADAYHTTWITGLHVNKTVDLPSADPFDELHYTITISNDGPQGFRYEGYLDDEG